MDNQTPVRVNAVRKDFATVVAPVRRLWPQVRLIDGYLPLDCHAAVLPSPSLTPSPILSSPYGQDTQPRLPTPHRLPENCVLCVLSILSPLN